MQRHNFTISSILKYELGIKDNHDGIYLLQKGNFVIFPRLYIA